MNKTYMKTFCDCCGCEIVEGSYNKFKTDKTDDFYNTSQTLYLPYAVEFRHNDGEVSYASRCIKLEDICNTCYNQIREFTKKLIPNLNDVIELE